MKYTALALIALVGIEGVYLNYRHDRLLAKVEARLMTSAADDLLCESRGELWLCRQHGIYCVYTTKDSIPDALMSCEREPAQ